LSEKGATGDEERSIHKVLLTELCVKNQSRTRQSKPPGCTAGTARSERNRLRLQSSANPSPGIFVGKGDARVPTSCHQPRTNRPPMKVHEITMPIATRRLVNRIRMVRTLPPNEKLTDSRLTVNIGGQSDVRQPERTGSRRRGRLFGGASGYTTFGRLDSPGSGGTLSLLDQFMRSGDSLSGPCPIHKGTNPTQFRVRTRGHRGSPIPVRVCPRSRVR
jgi:hypothetical protein